jgi:uncharacterized protein (TIGR02145 family)
MIFALLFSTSCKKDPQETNVTDIDGNIYGIIKIGDQTWMKENLRTTRLNNGVAIENITEPSGWSNTTSPAYCWYKCDPSNGDIYGGMYNYTAVSTGRLCPTGWHVPSIEDWNILVDYLGGISVAGGKMKESGTEHWSAPNSDATNQSGFTGLPGGYRSFRDGAFFSLKDNASWWSKSISTSSTAWIVAITLYNTTAVQVVSGDLGYGVSVRCIKDI